MGFGGKGGGGKGGGQKDGGDEGFGRGGGGDNTKPNLPGFAYTKDAVMPNFMQLMAGGGPAPKLDGIEGALQRRQGREEEDREDREEEAPVVIDAGEALTSKERRRLETSKPGSNKNGGSLRFKEGDTSAAAKFTESAHERVMAEDKRRADAAEEHARASVLTMEAAAAAGKAFLFDAGAAKEKKKKEGKRKAGAEHMPKAKAVKNPKLLSFEDED